MRASITRLLALGCIGLLSGAMLEEYFVLRYVLAHLDGAQWGRAHAAFGTFHPWTIIPLAVIGTVALFVIAAREKPRASTRGRLNWAVAGIGALVGGPTVGVMFPLNLDIEGWARTGLPADWQAVRDRWIGLQALRAVLSVSGFFLLVVASFLPGRPLHPEHERGNPE